MVATATSSRVLVMVPPLRLNGQAGMEAAALERLSRCLAHAADVVAAGQLAGVLGEGKRTDTDPSARDGVVLGEGVGVAHDDAVVVVDERVAVHRGTNRVVVQQAQA